MQEIHLINFKEVDGGINPMYFGLVRDPYSRFRSKYQFSRKSK